MWAVVPMTLGWHTVIVMSGSMEPRVQTGDALVYQPMSAAGLRPSQVIIVNDPAHQGHLLSHRLVKRLRNNELITRGDANRAADSTPVKPDAVLGLARLRIPYVGLPWKWLHEGRRGLAAGALAMNLAAMVAAGADRDDAGARGTGRPGHRGTRSEPGARGRGRGRRRRPSPALAAWSAMASIARARAMRPAHRTTWRSVFGGIGLALVLVATFSATSSAFTTTAANSVNSWAAASTFCTSPSTSTLTATADTYVDQGSPTSTNGSSGDLFIQSGVNDNQRTLVNFTLPTVPAGCSVTSATLTVTSKSGTSGRTIDAFRAATSWTESGATWNNQPATTGTAASSTSTSTSNGTVSITVTSQVAAMYPSSKFGFLVRDRTESASSTVTQRWFSRESSPPPKLTLVIG